MIEDLQYEITEEERSRRLAAVYRLLVELGQQGQAKENELTSGPISDDDPQLLV